jgi:pilus assembly protein Flp/PilA
MFFLSPASPGAREPRFRTATRRHPKPPGRDRATQEGRIMGDLMTKTNDLVLKAQTNADVYGRAWAETGAQKFKKRYTRPFDRGQTAVEYLGIIAVVVLIVAAIAGTDIGKKIFKAIKTQIGKVTGG